MLKKIIVLLILAILTAAPVMISGCHAWIEENAYSGK